MPEPGVVVEWGAAESLLGVPPSLPFQPIIPYCHSLTHTLTQGWLPCPCRRGARVLAFRSYTAYYQNQDFLQPYRASVLPGNCQSQFHGIFLVLWPWLAGEERLHRSMHDQHSRQNQGRCRFCLGHLKSSRASFSSVPGQCWDHRAGYRGQILQAKFRFLKAPASLTALTSSHMDLVGLM